MVFGYVTQFLVLLSILLGESTTEAPASIFGNNQNKVGEYYFFLSPISHPCGGSDTVGHCPYPILTQRGISDHCLT